MHHRCITRSALKGSVGTGKEHFQGFGVDFVRHDHVRVDVETDGGSRVPCAIRELPCGYALEVPQRDSAVSEAVRRTVLQPVTFAEVAHR